MDHVFIAPEFLLDLDDRVTESAEEFLIHLEDQLDQGLLTLDEVHQLIQDFNRASSL